MKKAIRIHKSDNVATLLADIVEEDIQIIGIWVDHAIHCSEPVKLGHKVAIAEIAMNSPVIKYGVVIGMASQPIRTGQWVHVHNCRSRQDERSGTLDLHTGLSQDVKYE